MQNMRLLAQHVEAVGLDSVWVSDHIVVPRHIDSFYPYDPEGCFPSAPDQAYYEPLTTLAFLAACTTRVQLGTSVLHPAVSQRPPYRQSRLYARCALRYVILGIGVGWMEENLTRLVSTRSTNAARSAMNILKFFGLCGRANNQILLANTCALRTLALRPNQPCQPHPPIWIGGHTPAAIRRAARLGDGWHPIGLRAPASLTPPRCVRPSPACAMRPARPAAIRRTLPFPSALLLPLPMMAAPRASP